MLKIAKQYTMNEDAVQNGKWIPFGEGAEVKIARYNNTEAEKIRKKEAAAFERPGFRMKKMSEADDRRITAKVLAYGCVKDWRNVSVEGLEGMLESEYGIKLSTEEAKAPKFTPELCLALLTWSEDFYRDVFLCAVNEDLFRSQDMEEVRQD